MGYRVSVYVLPALLLVPVPVGLAWYVWRRRQSAQGVTAFVVFLVALGLGLVNSALGIAATDPETAVLWEHTGVLLSLVSVPALLVFVLQYTNNDRFVRPSTVGALGLTSAGMAVALLTNGAHGQFWTGTEVYRDLPFTAVQLEYGPVGHLFVAYVGGLTLVMTVVILLRAVRTRGVYRMQSILLLAAVGVLAVANVVTWPHPGVNLGPYAVVGTAGLLTLAMARYDFLDLAPVARDTVVENMRDAVVVVNANDRIVDANPAAEAFFGDGAVGTRLADALGEEFAREYADVEETRAELNLSPGDGAASHEYDLRITPLSGRRGGLLGRVLVLRDVTALKERERQLDLLKQVFSRVLRHNIRNDMQVIHSYSDMLSDGDPVGVEDPAAVINDRAEKVLELGEKARAIERVVDADVDRTTLDLARVAERAVEDVRRDHPDADVETDVDPVAVRAAETLDLAVRNLVENAVVHGEGTVRVRGRAERDGRTVRLDVEDDGPGIPDHEIEVLQRGEEDDLLHGSGLGLWLVDRVVDESGASLAFDAAEGGTTVTITLAAATDADGVEEPLVEP